MPELSDPQFRERQGRSDRGRSKLDPYKDYLVQQWNQKSYETKQLFEEIQKQGYSGSYDTVARYTRRLRQATGLQKSLEHQVRRDRHDRKLEPYKDYLLQQWNQKPYETKQLFEEIKKQGYSGSYDTVARYTRCLRQGTELQLKPPIIPQDLPQVVEPLRCALTPRKAMGLVMQNFEELDANDQQLVSLLEKQSSEFNEAIELAQDFTAIVRQRTPEKLDNWLDQAINSNLSPIQRFARRLQEDYASVKAGVTFSVSNGPVEGHINRLKMLKRQMYGRANIDLLSQRFLIEM